MNCLKCGRELSGVKKNEFYCSFCKITFHTYVSVCASCLKLEPILAQTFSQVLETLKKKGWKIDVESNLCPACKDK